MDGLLPVRLDIRVERFHALTEKASYATVGVHAITFAMQVRDLETGNPIGEARLVKADLDAFGRQQALRAEAVVWPENTHHKPPCRGGSSRIV
jgi:hypothetical protein|tara:strand:- start:15367 stop:15645 length:279 start_codon:yes stop_codon:yes gene_type:complete